MLARRLFRSILAVALVAAAIVVLPQSSAQAYAWGPYHFIGRNSQKCLDNPNSSQADNTRMIIYTCGYDANQHWWNDDTPGGSYWWIRNGSSDKCLTVQNALTGNNIPVIQFSCNTGPNELWTWEDQGYGVTIRNSAGLLLVAEVWKIRNVKSGKCLTVTNNGTANKSTLVQFDCTSPGGNEWIQDQLPL